MPGVVEQIAAAHREVEQRAAEYGQNWNVRQAFDEDLRDIRRQFPDETYQQSIKHAVERITAEIQAAREHDLNQTQERQRAGYDQAHRIMDQEYDVRRIANPEATAAEKRQFVHDIAIQYSNSVRDNVGDRGRGWERIEHPDFETGERRAIRDWSHEHNHSLLQEIARISNQHERPTEPEHQQPFGTGGAATFAAIRQTIESGERAGKRKFWALSTVSHQTMSERSFAPEQASDSPSQQQEASVIVRDSDAKDDTRTQQSWQISASSQAAVLESTIERTDARSEQQHDRSQSSEMGFSL